MPLSLSIRVGSLRGTVRLHIKPPPSDQLWFGFTSTPDVEFELESSVGEHKITSGQVALYLINKFKVWNLSHRTHHYYFNFPSTHKQSVIIWVSSLLF